MKRTLSRLCALLLAGACALACHPMENYQTEKFKLAASPCVPEGYPAEIYRGNFLRSDGKSFPVPSGNFLTSDWRGYDGEFGDFDSFGMAAEEGPQDGYPWRGSICIAPYAVLILSREG